MGAKLFLLGLIVAVSVSCGDDDEDDDGHGHGNPDGIGNYCEKDQDCPSGTCYLGPGGGYCTSPCSKEGDTSECPADTVCKPIQGGPARCLLICGSSSSCDESHCPDEHCPSGSSCVSVSDTSARACEPNPG